jgi:hypothetical protein
MSRIFTANLSRAQGANAGVSDNSTIETNFIFFNSAASK